jgi:alpha/beta superfamily hydrolase
MRRVIFLFLLFAAISGTSDHAFAAWRESDESIVSRNDVKVQLLVARNVDKAAPDKSIEPEHIVIFFPGADGKSRNARGGVSEHRTGPDARPSTMGLLAEQLGMAVAFGLPSDQANGISVSWRMGKEHLADADAVIASLTKRSPNARISLIGMSNGARSATHVASAIATRGAPKLHSVVVMSAAPEALDPRVMQPIRDAKIPVLVMHHKRDSCLRFNDIEERAKNFAFIAVDDPKVDKPGFIIRSCGPGTAHVFGGKEAFTYGTLATWIKTGKVTMQGASE